MQFLSKPELWEFTTAVMRLLSQRRPKGINQNLITQLVREFKGIDTDLQNTVRVVAKSWVERWEANNTDAYNSCFEIRCDVLGEQLIDEADIPF
jgi:hypothetical protein